MGFILNVNGEKVWETDDRVRRIGIQTSQGEGGAVGIDATQGAANLIVEYLQNDGTPNLEDLDLVNRPRGVDDDAQQERIDEIHDVRVANAPDHEAQAEALTSKALTEAPDDEDMQKRVEAVAKEQHPKKASKTDAGDKAPANA